MSNWDITVGNYSAGGNAGPLQDVLSFSQGGSTFLAMANDGANATGVQISGSLDLASGNFSVDSGDVEIKGGDLDVNNGNLSVSNSNVVMGSFGVDVQSGGVSVQNGNVNVNGSGNFTGSVSAQNVFASNINQNSDRNLKEKFTAINPAEILARVVAMPISSWNFKQDASERHIGPMAQDFYAAFNVGPDDRHIATVDEGGVALAAIQGLNEKLQEKDAEIKALEKRMNDLEALIKSSNHP